MGNENEADRPIVDRMTARFGQQLKRRSEPGGKEEIGVMKQIGGSFYEIRRAVGLDPMEVSKILGMDMDELIAFESGFIPVEDLPENFLKGYTGVLVEGITQKGDK